MKPNKIFSMLLMPALLLFAASSAFAVTLTVDNETTYTGETTATVHVTVDNPSEIAGAAFTVVYDASNLTLTNVASTFFDTFANQGITPTSVTVDNETYTQPLVKGDEDPTLGNDGGTMLAAARVQAGATATTLFTLTFDITGAPLGNYTISIIQSTINNTDAGYAQEGETIPMLVGALDNETDLTKAFPSLTVDSVNPGTLSVTSDVRPCMKGDPNDDGDITAQDAVDCFWKGFQGAWTTIELCTCDYNEDSEVTSQDAVDIFWASLL